MTDEIRLRPAVPQDLGRVVFVESQATPGLRYLARVFDSFLNDQEGELSVAEVNGRLVGCGKFTVQPDGSAWLESLRVLPDYQGLGVGKRFYQRFLETARRKKITTMRMYTNIANEASKGLAERFGFQKVATYRGAWLDLQDSPNGSDSTAFRVVRNPPQATELLMPHYQQWTGFVVMNRTFYPLTPDLCVTWAAEGKVYEDRTGGSVIAFGARFMPEQALHIALAHGDMEHWLTFARQRAAELGVRRIQCMYPPSYEDMEIFLLGEGFHLDDYDCIVMEVDDCCDGEALA